MAHAQQSHPELPPLAGAPLIELLVHWKEGTADLLVGPLSPAGQEKLDASHVLLRFHGLRRLDCWRLQPAAEGVAEIEAVDGPRGSPDGWQLQIKMLHGHTIGIEFSTVAVRRAFPGQKHANETDLDTRLRELLGTNIHALVVGDFAGIRCPPGRATPEDIKREMLEYPATFIDPPLEAFDEMDVCAVRGEEGLWRVEMPLWSREEGRSDLSIQLDVHLVGDDLVGYVEAVHVL